jgi:purine-binding chemotaxis protein CheW
MNPSPSTTPRVAMPGKYLAVLLANESYGIPILRVREIIRMTKITPIPQAPSWMSGVINLRGRVIGVVDLRAKFGLPGTIGERTCIVVVHVPLKGDHAVFLGLVVDSVEEVVNVGAAEIEPTPDFGVRLDTHYLLGVAKSDGQVSMLLDIDHVVVGDELAGVAEIAA